MGSEIEFETSLAELDNPFPRHLEALTTIVTSKNVVYTDLVGSKRIGRFASFSSEDLSFLMKHVRTIVSVDPGFESFTSSTEKRKRVDVCFKV